MSCALSVMCITHDDVHIDEDVHAHSAIAVTRQYRGHCNFQMMKAFAAAIVDAFTQPSTDQKLE